ncbi:MAG: tetratricopeptide repeat protein [Candidatus Omnitrophica bacterium]|nr:tetratricopeptide repeat protein [Candidatus Omnitrophota bacterium]
MLLGQRLYALRMVLFLSLLAVTSPSYAWGSMLDSKAQGLAHYILAVCHDLNGENSQAISEYQKSIKFNGWEPAPRLKLGAYYLRLTKISQATVQFKTVARISPQEPQAHYLLALIYSSEHKYDLAASEYEIILKLASRNDQGNTDVYLYLGQLYYAQQKYPQAIEQFLKVTEFNPGNASALFLLGSVWADSNDHAKAIEAFRKVLRIEPEHTEALNSLGYMYAEDGVHLDEAIRMISKAIEIDPANGAFYDSLGWALYKKGMYAQALAALQKAETYIKDEILYDHIGDDYKALKDYRGACQYWQKSLDLNPRQTLIQQKIRELKKWIASHFNHRLN